MDKLNNKGFVFIEMVVTVAILLTTLVLVYSSYSNVILAEKKRLYYDDISYVYRSNVLKKILNKSLNMEKLNEAVSDTDNYIYIFDYGSNIYNQQYVERPDFEPNKNNYILKELKNDGEKPYYTGLAYLKISEIGKLKECLKKKENIDEKCEKTQTMVRDYGKANLKDYLLTLDVPVNYPTTGTKTMYHDSSNNDHDAILITFIYETKSGEKYDNDTNKYQECLQQKVFEHFPSYPKEKALNEYYSNNNLNFDMHCQAAYYISWVYL